MIRFIFFIVILIIPGSVYTQVDLKNFNYYNSYDGLSDNHVRCIAQDSSGYLWIGTSNGLNRFDGYKFVNYFPEENNSSTITSRSLSHLFCDHNGTLWIATYTGLNYYDAVHDRFNHFFIPLTNTAGRSVRQITCDPQGNLLLATATGLYRVDPLTRRTVFFKNLAGYDLICFTKDKDTVYAGTSKKGYLKLTFTGNNVHCHFYMNDYLKDKDISSMKIDENGCLWIGTREDGLMVFDHSGQNLLKHFSENHPQHFKISGVSVNAFYHDDQKNVWIGNDTKAMDIFFQKTNRIVKLPILDHIFDKPEIFRVKQFFPAQDNSLWIGTLRGLFHYKENTRFIRHFPVNNLFPDDVISTDVRSFFEDTDGTVWIGMDDGFLLHTDAQFTSFRKYQLNNTASIRAISASANHLLLGCYRGLVIADKVTLKSIKNIYFNTQNSKNNIINSIYLMSDNTACISTGTGLVLLNTTDYSFEKFQLPGYDRDFQQFMAIPLNDSIIVYLKPSQLSLFNRNTKTITPLQLTADTIKMKDFIHLYYTDSMTYYATTDGIIMHNLKTNKTRFKSLKYLIQVSDISNVIADDLGFLWISNSRTVFRYHPLTEEINSFDSKLLLNNVNFSNRAVYKLKNGNLLIGGKRGFNLIEPSNVKLDTTKYPMIISKIKINSERLNIHYGYKQKTELNLKHFQSNIMIEFTLLNFISPEATKYSFFMDGYDAGWNETGNSRIAIFSKLPPGKYTFYAQAQDIFNRSFYTPPLFITISPPFWETTWFILLIISIIAGTIILVFLLREKRHKEQKEELERLVNERTIEILEKNEELRSQNDQIEIQKNELQRLNATKDRLFTIIAHDLKNPFSAISGFSSLLINNFDEYSEEQKLELIRLIQSSSSNAFELLQNLLTWSRANLNVIRYKPEKIQINEMVKEICRFMEILARNKNIRLLLNEQQSINAFADKEMLNTVIRNLIANAIKFTAQGGTVTVSFEDKNNMVAISISDTGVGMSAGEISKLFKMDEVYSTSGTEGEKGTGIGLLLCKDFIERNYGQIFVNSKPGAGSCFTVEIPKS